MWMVEGRGQESWAHTSAVLSLIANVNRDPKKSRQFKPSDFDPYAQRKRREQAIEVTDMALLKKAFTGG